MTDKDKPNTRPEPVVEQRNYTPAPPLGNYRPETGSGESPPTTPPPPPSDD